MFEEGFARGGDAFARERGPGGSVRRDASIDEGEERKIGDAFGMQYEFVDGVAECVASKGVVFCLEWGVRRS